MRISDWSSDVCSSDLGGVATITLARPERMNAINATMTLELISALDIVDKDDEVRAIILTGEGEKAFCAGADISGGAATFDYAKRDPEIGRASCRGRGSKTVEIRGGAVKLKKKT